MLGQLIKELRAVIDAVAIAQPRTWSDVHAVMVMAKKGAPKTAKGDIAPRTVEQLKRHRKSATCAQPSLLSALVSK